MLKLRPTFEQIEREARTSRLKILPEKQKRTQQGILLDASAEASRGFRDGVNFDDFDLDKYNIRNKATQTDMFDEPSNYSSASSNRSVKTVIEGNEKQDSREARETLARGSRAFATSRQVSLSSGESLDDVRYRTRMSIADDLASMARVGGNIIYYTGQGIGQGINMAVDAYNWWNDEDEEDEEPPIDEEQPSRSNQAMRLLRRGASRSRSGSSTPKRGKK